MAVASCKFSKNWGAQRSNGGRNQLMPVRTIPMTGRKTRQPADSSSPANGVDISGRIMSSASTTCYDLSPARSLARRPGSRSASAWSTKRGRDGQYHRSFAGGRPRVVASRSCSWRDLPPTYSLLSICITFSRPAKRKGLSIRVDFDAITGRVHVERVSKTLVNRRLSFGALFSAHCVL